MRGKIATVTPQVEAAVHAAGAAGISPPDVVSRVPNTTLKRVRNLLSLLKTRGKVFRAGSFEHTRYFARQEDAQAYAVVARAQQDVRRKELARIAERARYEQKPRIRPSQASNWHSGWAPEAVATLREKYAITDTRELAAELGRTPQALMLKAAKLQLRKQRPEPKPVAHREQPVARERKRAAGAQPTLKIARNLGPAYLPGDLDTLPRSPGFRYTVYPRKPDPIRTQTHSQFGG